MRVLVKFSLIAVLFTILVDVQLHAQDFDDRPNVIKTEYTQIDKISRKFYSFLGSSSGNIEFILVEIVNLTTQEKLLGVEVNIRRTDTEVLGYSLGLSNIGSLWGSNSSITARNLTKSGHIFFLYEDLNIVIDFMNSVVAAIGVAQDNYKVYSVSMYDVFQLSMIYENGWGFVVHLDSAHYKLDYIDGIAMLRKMSDFRRYISEHQ